MKRILNCVLVCMIIFSLAANVMADELVLDDPEYIEELDLPEMTDEEMRVLNNSASLLYDAENSESDHAVIYRSEEELAVLHLELERELERMLAEAPILTYDGAAVLTNDGAAVSEAAAAQAQVLTLSAANKAPMVAAGTSHNVFLKADGTVYTWGDYSLEETYTAPAKVAGIDHVVEVDAGNNFSLALRSDGTVWAWGYAGSSGVLGTDAQGQPVGSSMTPVQVSGLSNITAISAGEYHCLALEADGTVWAWGTNTYGQLGAAGFTYTAAPSSNKWTKFG